ncbi:MAG: T9SS type A sorting domain-containing protein [bacterium]
MKLFLNPFFNKSSKYISNIFTLRMQLITVILLISCFSISNAQYQNIKVGGSSLSPPEEPSIVMDPLNTDHLLVGSNVNHYYYSINGGYNWNQGTISSSHGIVGDPCVLVDTTGNYYYIHLVPGLSKVVCQKTTSLGASWSDGSYTGVDGTKENDKEYAVIDRKNNYIYVAWAQFDQHGSANPQDSSEIELSRSTDGGLSFSAPIKISNRKGNAQAGNGSCHCPMPAVGPNNDVYVTWMSPYGLMVDISHNNGLIWLNTDINVTPSRVSWLTFNIPGVQRSPGFPIINCDLSTSPYHGNIYICWADQRNASYDTEIWMAKSTDGGYTWSSRIKVNDDQSAKHQFFPWMTIDQTNGYIYVVFYDRRNYTDSKTDVYMAVSKDGGQTFVNTKISETPFTPLQTDFIGDYINIAAHNNIVRPVWTRADNGNISLWTAIINTPVSVDEKSPNIKPEDFEITSVYPNPFNPSTTIYYKLNKGGHVELKVFDMLGQDVITLLDLSQISGEHKIIWDAKNMASGPYIVQLQFGNLKKSQKIILLK